MQRRWSYTISACVIGLGKRNYNLISKILLQNKDLNIISVCDVYVDRITKAIKCIKKHGGDPKGFTDYKDALNTSGLQAVFVFTGWEMHTEVAVYAMKKGIPVATEVGCEYTLDNVIINLKTIGAATVRITLPMS